jgi:hypothetical protein
MVVKGVVRMVNCWVMVDNVVVLIVLCVFLAAILDREQCCESKMFAMC